MSSMTSRVKDGADPSKMGRDDEDGGAPDAAPVVIYEVSEKWSFRDFLSFIGVLLWETELSIFPWVLRAIPA